MRWTMLLVLLMVAPATAQVVVLEDEGDDATASAAGVADVQGYDTRGFDLVSLAIDERTDAFDFILQVSGLDKDPETELDSAVYTVDFQHEDVGYRLRYVRQVLFGGVGYYGDVMVFDAGRQGYVTIHRGDLDVSVGDGTMTFEVPRQMLVDGNGTAPTLGREFSLLRAFSRANMGIFAEGFSALRIEDAMPDSGFSEEPYKIVQGLVQTGHARLFSENPVRASNGEEATFVYYVDAVNLGEGSDRFDLGVEGVPQGWRITLPAPTIRIDGNSTQPFPVLVTIPFTHQHGAFEDFVLTLTSHRDRDSVGQIQMGVRYLEIPQPAGHHDRVWIHTRSEPQNGITIASTLGEAPRVAYMNAMEEHDVDEDVEVPPTQTGCCGPESVFTWDIYLEPGLQLGLDFDVNDTGSLFVEFTSDVPRNDVVLTGQLLHFGHFEEGRFGAFTDDATLLGEFASTTPQALNGPTTFETVFTPKKAADFIEYRPGAALMLRLQLTGTDFEFGFGPDAAVPRLLSTGEMRLPLFEYRDPVEDVFNALAGIALDHADRAEKYVNPGETVLLNLTLTNEGAVDDVFTLKVNGTNEEWARILGDDKVFVRTGTSRAVVVAVTPPEDALDGDVVDLIVTAASEAEPAIQGNIRVVAVVDDLLDRPDEAHLLGDVERGLTKDKDSPAVPVLLLLGALVFAARSKRS